MNTFFGIMPSFSGNRGPGRWGWEAFYPTWFMGSPFYRSCFFTEVLWNGCMTPFGTPFGTLLWPGLFIPWLYEVPVWLFYGSLSIGQRSITFTLLASVGGSTSSSMLLPMLVMGMPFSIPSPVFSSRPQFHIGRGPFMPGNISSSATP